MSLGCPAVNDSSAGLPVPRSVFYPGFEHFHLADQTGNKRCFALKRQTITASEVYFT